MRTYKRDCALVVFAKEPQKGRVKTRLEKDIGSDRTLELYKAFVKDVTFQLHGAAGADQFIYYSSDDSQLDFLSGFKDKWMLRPQQGVHLGERMFHAFCELHVEGYQKTIIIGTDCLTITPNDISGAFQQLNGHDCVLGPTQDGGYYLIALKEPAKNLFKNIPWSTDQVLDRTLVAAKKCGKSIYFLEKREDVDYLQALYNLYTNEEVHSRIPHTLRVLKTCCS